MLFRFDSGWCIQTSQRQKKLIFTTQLNVLVAKEERSFIASQFIQNTLQQINPSYFELSCGPDGIAVLRPNSLKMGNV